jgi:hypothetical protein
LRRKEFEETLRIGPRSAIQEMSGGNLDVRAFSLCDAGSSSPKKLSRLGGLCGGADRVSGTPGSGVRIPSKKCRRLDIPAAHLVVDLE